LSEIEKCRRDLEMTIVILETKRNTIMSKLTFHYLN